MFVYLVCGIHFFLGYSQLCDQELILAVLGECVVLRLNPGFLCSTSFWSLNTCILEPLFTPLVTQHQASFLLLEGGYSSLEFHVA